MIIEKKLPVSIKYFSVLAQITKKNTETITIAQGDNLQCLLEQLKTKYPDFEKYIPFTLLAVNHVYVSRDYQPEESDEIALITPVSGG